MNRVADNRLARDLLDWEPQVPLAEGLRRTIDWYFSTHDPVEVAARLDGALIQR